MTANPVDRGKLSCLALICLILWTLVTLSGCERYSNTEYGGSLETEQSAICIYFTKPRLSRRDPNHPAQVIARYIGQTQKELDVCAHELDNEIITRAILEAHRRGVRVRVVTETAYKDEKAIHALQSAGVPVVDDAREGALMHNKFIVFDRQAVWTGSMNFTENCTDQNDNHGIYVADKHIAENYATKFRWFFEHRKFGGLPEAGSRIPYPVVKLADGTVIENYFAPHDRPAEKIIQQIRSAKSSIHFLAFSFTHPGIAEAMLERAKNGVSVQGVCERRQAIAGHSMFHKLAKGDPPVEVYLDGNNYNMHHKVIILDGQVTIAGSFNFSIGADRDNDENVLIIHSRKIAERFEREFQRILAQAR